MRAGHYVVTGGAGFIGSHLVDALVARNHEVVVLDDFSTGRRENLRSAEDSGRLSVVAGDVRDNAALMGVARNAKGIFHLAALVSVQRSIEVPLLSFDVNVRGTLNVLEAARAHRVPRVVYASSAAVYGNAAPPVSERMIAESPLSPYALDKRVAERYGALYSELYGVGTTALRFFNVYGSRQDPHSPYTGVISIFAEKLRTGAGIGVHGDGEQTRDFVHVADAVRASLAAMDETTAAAQVYNVGCGAATSINRLIELLSAMTGRPVTPNYLPARVGDIRHSLADISKIRAQLRFEPAIGLAAGLEELMASLEQP